MVKIIEYQNKNVIMTPADIAQFEVQPTPEKDPVALQIEGDCPRCKHAMSLTHYLIAFRGVAPTSPESFQEMLEAASLVPTSLLPTEFSVQCSCTEKHPGPKGKGQVGCGAFWRMRCE